MIEFKFKFLSLLSLWFFLHCLICISVQQSNIFTGVSDLDNPPPIWTCNGTDLTVRSYDATCNNLIHNNWGAPNRVFDRRFFPAYYEDNFSGSPKINIDCRNLTNYLSDNGLPPTFTGNPLGDDILSSTRKSMFDIYFGQLVNHDQEGAALQIATPDIPIGDITNDPVFNNRPNKIWNPKGAQFMTLLPSLGRILNSTLYPANKANSFLDLSAVYGNNPNDGFALRMHSDGLMLLSKFETDGGVYNKKLGKVIVDNVTPSSRDAKNLIPSLNDPVIPIEKAMVSGDRRASENVQLSIMHTIWIREHNFQAKKIVADNPTLAGNDEEIFQRARRITIAEYQHVIFEEFLPALLGFKMPAYGGYDPNVYVDTAIHFSSAAFRYAHAQTRPYNIIDGCSEELITLHPDFPLQDSHPNRFFYVGRSAGVEPTPGSGLTHDQVDYTPARMIALASGTSGLGVDNIIVSMLREPAAQFNLMITTALRNIPPAMDLFAMDIARGRFNGLQPYNQYREVFHPAGNLYSNPACDINASTDSLECFSLITSNQTIAKRLQMFYGKVGDIDAIVGMFAEDKQAETSPLPPTITNIIKEEFQKKRYGDRFWYEGDMFMEEEKTLIKSVSMKQIIERVTNVVNVQVNPFKNPGPKEELPIIANAKCDEAEKAAKSEGAKLQNCFMLPLLLLLWLLISAPRIF